MLVSRRVLSPKIGLRRSRPVPIVGAVRCVRCGYDLRGLSVLRCPECGLLHNVPVQDEPEWRWFHLRAWVVCAPVTLVWLLWLTTELPIVVVGPHFIPLASVIGRAVAVGAFVSFFYAVLSKFLSRTERDGEWATCMIVLTAVESATASAAFAELR